LIRIDWDEYKEHKKMTVRENKLEIVLEFLKSYYNMTNPSDVYETMRVDDIGQMLLEKYEINSDVDLENILFKM
jgi:hypothetical protein